MARGRRPNLERHRQAAELRARGLTLVEVGRRMGCTRQAIHQLLGHRAGRPYQPRPPRTVPCAACGADLGPAPTTRDYAPALCLPCLARRPRATLGQRLRAHRLARGLSREALCRRAGLGLSAVASLERGAHRPQPGTLRKLAAALGVGSGELLPGDRRRG
jgi:transcriptional regulator with XRE-family HTH domain